MKFGKKMQEEREPEWLDKYIDYKKMKKEEAHGTEEHSAPAADPPGEALRPTGSCWLPVCPDVSTLPRVTCMFCLCQITAWRQPPHVLAWACPSAFGAEISRRTN
eukprot:CAMPEP_0168400564 /NCGR_PEP_ID=MMETSP0228-20121227/22663_1 /TAXON_ID=133427 /ORGANISM="Protoceratium reticulatum, Strain CCCM 535 (=CCMP 1889)" /LENGTH=104 /DNA_ID=CAMNT_0008414109 /DNA_START=128 /DNA_END=440 /DNA_ORIENTATION=+